MNPRARRFAALPPGARARVRLNPHGRGLGGMVDYDQNSQPPGFYDEATVFNERGPEGYELISGPSRAFTQFGFSLAAGVAIRLLAANVRRYYLLIQNASAADVMFIGFGSAPTVTSGFGLIPGAAAGGGGSLLCDYMVPTDDVYALCAAAANGVCGEGVLTS